VVAGTACCRDHKITLADAASRWYMRRYDGDGSGNIQQTCKQS
jgi:hypothetical protein